MTTLRSVEPSQARWRTTKPSSHAGGLALCFAAIAAASCTQQDTQETPAVLSGEASALTAQSAPEPELGDRSDVMKYMARLPAEKNGERALAAIFASGTAQAVPTGLAKGYPVLFNSVPEFNWLASQLWGGKTFRVVSTDSQGAPVVRLDNMILRTDTGGLLDLFDAYVTLGKVKDTRIGVNDRGETIAPPTGTLKTVDVSFLSHGATIDDRPSIILNYFEDESLPVIRRVLDEIREVDAQACPGFYLGRAHVRRCVSLGCGEFPTAIVDRLEKPVVQTRNDWRFWTYFLLDFNEVDATCDLTSLMARTEQTLSQSGFGADLPQPPVVQ